MIGMMNVNATGLLNVICFGLAAHFVFSNKKAKLDTRVLGWFWFVVFIFFSIVTFITTIVEILPTSVVNTGLQIAYLFSFAQIGLAAFYVVARLIKRFWLRAVLGIYIFTVSVILAVVFLTQASPATKDTGVLLMKTPVNTQVNYLGSFMLAATLIIGFLVIAKDMKSGKFSWTNMLFFYDFYSLIVYFSISIIRLLGFIPNAWFVEIFHAVIPYLMYRSKKESQ